MWKGYIIVWFCHPIFLSFMFLLLEISWIMIYFSSYSIPLILQMGTLFSGQLNIILLLTEDISQSFGCLKTINILGIYKTRAALTSIFFFFLKYLHPCHSLIIQRWFLQIIILVKRKNRNDNQIRNNLQSSYSEMW